MRILLPLARRRAARSFLPGSAAFPSLQIGLSHDLRFQRRNAPSLIPLHRSGTYSLYTPAGIADARDSPWIGGVPRSVPFFRGRSPCRGTSSLVRNGQTRANARIVLHYSHFPRIGHLGVRHRRLVGHEGRRALREPGVDDQLALLLLTARRRRSPSFLRASHGLRSREAGLSLDLRLPARIAPRSASIAQTLLVQSLRASGQRWRPGFPLVNLEGFPGQSRSHRHLAMPWPLS